MNKFSENFINIFKDNLYSILLDNNNFFYDKNNYNIFTKEQIIEILSEIPEKIINGSEKIIKENEYISTINKFKYISANIEHKILGFIFSVLLTNCEETNYYKDIDITIAILDCLFKTIKFTKKYNIYSLTFPGFGRIIDERFLKELSTNDIEKVMDFIENNIEDIIVDCSVLEDEDEFTFKELSSKKNIKKVQPFLQSVLPFREKYIIEHYNIFIPWILDAVPSYKGDIECCKIIYGKMTNVILNEIYEIICGNNIPIFKEPENLDAIVLASTLKGRFNL